jgi:hypothetical protein
MLYVVEYSQSQKAFHISTFQERLVNETRCLLRGIKSDYKVIHECDTYEEASEFVQENLMQQHELHR